MDKETKPKKGEFLSDLNEAIIGIVNKASADILKLVEVKMKESFKNGVEVGAKRKAKPTDPKRQG